MKILIVDDSTTMRRIMINNLARIGHNDVLVADNGKTGLERLDGGGVNLILTDWNMPELDGLEFVKRVRSGPHKDIPILLVTTGNASQDITEALEAGVDGYVIKPLTPETLRQQIELVMDS